MPVDVEAIASLLQQSKQAHARYRSAKPRMIPQPGGMLHSPGNPLQAITALQQAADFRQQAQDADPLHEAPAWTWEPQHDEVMAFYAAEQAKHAAKEEARAVTIAEKKRHPVKPGAEVKP